MGASNVPLIILLTLDIITINLESVVITPMISESELVPRYTKAPKLSNITKRSGRRIPGETTKIPESTEDIEAHKLPKVFANETNKKAELMMTYSDNEKLSYLLTTSPKSKRSMGKEENLEYQQFVMEVMDPTVTFSDATKTSEITPIIVENVDNSFKLSNQNHHVTEENLMYYEDVFDDVAKRLENINVLRATAKFDTIKYTKNSEAAADMFDNVAETENSATSEATTAMFDTVKDAENSATSKMAIDKFDTVADAKNSATSEAATAMFDTVADAENSATSIADGDNSFIKRTVPGLNKQPSELAELSIISAYGRQRRGPLGRLFGKKTTLEPDGNETTTTKKRGILGGWFRKKTTPEPDGNETTTTKKRGILGRWFGKKTTSADGPKKKRGFFGRWFGRKTTTTTSTTTTTIPVMEETLTTAADICQYISLNCLKAYRTGNICARTAFYLYATFQHYCMMEFINCKEGYDVWQIVHMGQCYGVELLTDYKHYPYENDYFLDKDYVMEN